MKGVDLLIRWLALALIAINYLAFRMDAFTPCEHRISVRWRRPSSTFRLERHIRSSSWHYAQVKRPKRICLSAKKDEFFDSRTTVGLIAGQSVLVVVAMAMSVLLQTPNYGLGPGISFDSSSVYTGVILALPLGALAAALDVVEDRYPALQDVTKATQRSVLGLLGGTFKPFLAFLVSAVLGLSAGLGEEMLFRGVLQYKLSDVTGSAAALLLSSVVFGALHSVTPLYAFLAMLASIYFGLIYVAYDNLAVAIACHAFYDLGALFYAHWTVSQLNNKERIALAMWDGPTNVGKRRND